MSGDMMNQTRSPMIWYSTLQHPLVGDLLLVANEHRLLRSSYLDCKLAPQPVKEWICDPTQEVLAKAISQLDQYFQGKRSQFTVPLQIQATKFQKKVYHLVQEVPVGALTTYKELAAKLEMTGAARSIGAAIGKNPLLIFIPDHRVVTSSGSVGGFAGKWNRKPGLLELEKRMAG
jgi:methylated-DNA-[protein]-cysteine S-methyltransferase